MDDQLECTILEIQSPGQRKLKQGRLPFSPVESSQQKETKNDKKSDNLHTEESEKDKSKDKPDSCKPEVGKLPKPSVDEPGMIDLTSPEKAPPTSSEEKENLNAEKKGDEIISSQKDSDINDTSNGKNSHESAGEKSRDHSVASKDSTLKEPSSRSAKGVKCSSDNIKINKDKKAIIPRKKKRKLAPLASSPSIDLLFKKIKNTESKPAGRAVSSSDPDVVVCDSSDANESDKNMRPPSPSTSNSSFNNSGFLTSSSEAEASPSCISSSNLSGKSENVKPCPADSSTASQMEGSPTSRSSESLAHKKRLFSKITPKLLAKQREMQEKQEERRKLFLQKELLKKSKQEEKQRIKEEKDKKKLEDTELKDKEKEERRLKKEEERVKREGDKVRKDEDKQKKEEERLKRENEKRKKEEEKRLADEEEKEKKEKVKAKFAQFFVPKKETTPPLTTESQTDDSWGFMKFQIKENMRVAPLFRAAMSDARRSLLNSLFSLEQNEQLFHTYLEEIKKADYVPGKSPRTYPPEEKREDDDECEIIEEEEDEFGLDENNAIVKVESSSSKTKVKAKLLQFCENRRPAYFGTWFKKSSVITGRRPLGKEIHILDYDYDSDDDWEEEEVGESLSDSEGENEDAGEEVEQYEVDNDFFVPHGYLSDDEGKEDEEREEELEGKKEETENKDLDAQKERLKMKQAEFEIEMKEKKKALKPKIYGCIWVGDKNCHPAYDRLVKILSAHRAINLTGSALPITTKDLDANLDSTISKDNNGEEHQSTKRLGKNFPEEAVPDLIRMIHGNRYSKRFLTREFFEYWNSKHKKKGVDEGRSITDTPTDGVIPKRKIEMKIRELGNYGRFTEGGISHKHRTWYVAKDIREKYGLVQLGIHNSWTYIITPKEWPHNDPKMETDQAPDGENEEPPKPKSAANLITKFTKVLTDQEMEEERKRNLTSAPKTPSSATSALASCTPTSIQNNADATVSAALDNAPSRKVESPSSVPNRSSKKRSSSPPGNVKKKKRISFITLSKNEKTPSQLKENDKVVKPPSSLPVKKTEDQKSKSKNPPIFSFFVKGAEKHQKADKKKEEEDCIVLD